MTESLRVLIVDEDPDSRVATRKALVRANLGIAGETGYGTQASSLALEVAPDAVLVCLEEPVARPLETAEALANALPDTPILIYSSKSDTEAVRRGMVFGARDYLLKPLQGNQLREAVFRALDQEERRQMRRAGQLSGEVGRGTVICVTGAKGGIGKSVASVNLAVALRLETGKSVALVDADTQFGDVATLLDLAPVMTAADLLRHPEAFDRAGASGFMTRHSSGVEVLATARDEDPWMACPPGTWQGVIDTLAQLYEFVVIDTSGAFDAFVRRAIECASLTLLITTGEVSSVRDTAAALKRLNNWGTDLTRVRIVFNRGARAGGVSKDDLARAVGSEVFWELPNDQAVPRSVQFGVPVVLDARNNGLGQNVRGLARLIAGTKRSLVTQPETQPSLLQRLISFRRRGNDTAAVAAPEPDTQR
jgi:pilus assembly protein CpaE